MATRTRRRIVAEPILTSSELLRAMHTAGRDHDAWAALRPQAIRSLSRRLKQDDAERIFDVYRRRPELLPSLPPKNFKD